MYRCDAKIGALEDAYEEVTEFTDNGEKTVKSSIHTDMTQKLLLHTKTEDIHLTSKSKPDGEEWFMGLKINEILQIQPKSNSSTDKIESTTMINHIVSTICCFAVCTACMESCRFGVNYSVIFHIMCRVLGSILYSMDVVTDILTGVYLIRGKSIDYERLGSENYTVEFCEHFEKYSHPIWGSLMIAFSWAPAIIFVPALFSLWYSRKRNEDNSLVQHGIHTEPYWKTGLMTFLFVCIWPLTGIVMYVK